MTTVTCVVDNKILRGKSLNKEHGLAFWIKTEHGTVLFDTGQKGKVLMHNLSMLDLDPRDVDVLAVSHSHFDHTGGLAAVIKENPALTIVANEDIFEPRYSRKKGKYEFSGLEIERDDLEKKINIRLNSTPVEIFPELWTSGEITQRIEPEGRSSSHYVRVVEEWIPDPYRDDMSLVLKTADGLAVICGCCHAGLLNTLSHIDDYYEGAITAVIGGIHLMAADKKTLDYVVHELCGRYPGLTMYLNHCTGDDAIKALKVGFGDRVHAFPAGLTVVFDDPVL